MNLELQFRIKNNPNLVKFLHEHSEWYKILNRNPNMFSAFEDKMKEEYKLRPSDRFEKVVSTIDMLQTVLSSLR